MFVCQASTGIEAGTTVGEVLDFFELCCANGCVLLTTGELQRHDLFFLSDLGAQERLVQNKRVSRSTGTQSHPTEVQGHLAKMDSPDRCYHNPVMVMKVEVGTSSPLWRQWGLGIQRPSSGTELIGYVRSIVQDSQARLGISMKITAFSQPFHNSSSVLNCMRVSTWDILKDKEEATSFRSLMGGELTEIPTCSIEYQLRVPHINHCFDR